MVIGIDGNEVNVERRVGIGEYAFELLKKFEEFNTQDLKFKIYLKSKPLGHMPKEREGWKYEIFGPKKMWTQLALPLKLFYSKDKPDLFFSPSHYAPRFSPVPTAISVMDLSYIYFPELFNKDDLYQLRNWTKYSVEKAVRVFTISNSSRDDIIKEYNVDPKKVVVIYPGVRDSAPSYKVSKVCKVESMIDIKKKFGIEGNYILFVGTLQPRKNIVRLIEAFAKIKKQETESKELNLVIVGKKGWKYEEILAAPEKFGVKESVKFLENVTNEDLPSFYKNALCFCLPSLYEGFGLPVLEAMRYGCPVVTSNVSSLPEAGGDAALYCNPEDVEDIVTNLKLITENLKLREGMIKKGYEQVKKFSWEKTARKTLNVLEETGKKV